MRAILRGLFTLVCVLFCGCASPPATPHAGKQAQPQSEVEAASHVELVSTVIRDGIARITLRNNNPFPIRNLNLEIDYTSATRETRGPVFVHRHFVKSLILPGQEYEVDTFDSTNPSVLAPHSSGMPDEWIPQFRVLSLEIIQKQELSHSVLTTPF